MILSVGMSGGVCTSGGRAPLIDQESISGESSGRAINSTRSPTVNVCKGESIAKV